MESLGVPRRVQVTHAVMERLNGIFRFEARGLVEVKGKGPTATYFLLDRVSPATMDPVDRTDR